MVTSAACASARTAPHRRRWPERTLLYRTVQNHSASTHSPKTGRLSSSFVRVRTTQIVEATVQLDSLSYGR